MNTSIDIRTPHPKEPTVDAGQSKVLAARANLKQAEREVDAASRHEWKQKAQVIGRDARQAKEAFDRAKAEFAQADAAIHNCAGVCGQIETDLRNLTAEYLSLDFPSDEETQTFEAKKVSLSGKLDEARKEQRAAAHRKGAAWNAELRAADDYERLRISYRNALARSRGETLGEPQEGGIFRVE